MQKIVYRFKQTAAISAALCMLVLFPATSSVTFAADSCTPPPQTGPGVHWPTGSDAGTFTYQCDGQYQGMWTNAHYIYDPATSARTPIEPPVYTYNNTTGLWDTGVWDYNANTGEYMLDTVSVQTPPAGAATVGGPPAPAPATGSNNQTANNGGTQFTGGTSLNGTSDTTNNNSTGATMTNGVSSLANSGNATISYGTGVGSATSGSVLNEANIINMLQSTTNSLGGPAMLTFTANINGDVTGDILLDPAKLSTIQPAGTNANLNNGVTLNNSVDASINNDISLGANSGNATIDHGTVAGDATSGNAQAVANITNILNSAVNAGQSFVGIININGNLDGDILLPPNFIDTLLASNVPRYVVDGSSINTTSNVSNTANQSINNNISESAVSGNANSLRNTEAGGAATGDATATLTVFNLTGNEVVASNDIMVFVNNLGKWYGMILNAPAGATAASLGGGVISNANITDTSSLNNTANQSINNNIHVNSKSGDATIADSTKAGNAKSGDATSSVILMNMINDRLSLSGWFGLLFINVFGSWNGSFGINTSAGDKIPLPTVPGSDSSATGGAGSTPMFQFVPKAGAYNNPSGGTYTSSGQAIGNSGDGSSDNLGKAAVLAASAIKPATQSAPDLASGHTSYLLPLLGAGLAAIILLVGERGRFLHRANK